jgi:hypothetical protein
MKSALFAFALLVFSNCFGQDYESMLTTFSKEHPQEKVYIHYDKESYVAGETVWFKAYLYANSQPSTQSINL